MPPVDNLLRAFPVLGVTDNRRLTLWLAFGLAMLGGIGLDQVGRTFRLGRGWVAAWLVAATGLAAVALAVPMMEPAIRARAVAHYRPSADESEADGHPASARAERQVRATLTFLPRYYGLAATELGLLFALAVRARTGRPRSSWLPPALLVLSVTEVFAFGVGMNPAIDRRIHEFQPPVIARLRERLGPGAGHRRGRGAAPQCADASRAGRRPQL